jgi:hypothetical protein
VSVPKLKGKCNTDVWTRSGSVTTATGTQASDPGPLFTFADVKMPIDRSKWTLKQLQSECGERGIKYVFT